MELQTRAIRICLQVKRRQLHLLLFLIGKTRQGGGEAIGKDGGQNRCPHFQQKNAADFRLIQLFLMTIH